MKSSVAVIAVVFILAGCAADPGKAASEREAARANLQMGGEYARKGEYALAVDKLERAIKEDSELAQAHSMLAYVYSKMGQNGLAEEHYRKALMLDTTDAAVRNNFGVFLCANGKAAEGQRLFIEAATNKNYSTPAAAWTNAGVCARTQSDLAGAERHFREALAVNPQFPDALAQMAWLTYQKHDFLRCRGFLQRYEGVAQPTAETLWIGAMNERQLGDLEAARNYESRLRREFPESEQVLNLKSSAP